MELIKRSIQCMNEQGIFQWNDDYPNIEVVSRDIRGQELYVLKVDEVIAGIVTLNGEISIDFRSRIPESTGKEFILHRLAIHPGYQGRDLAGKLLDFAYNYAVAKGYQSIILSVLAENYIARNLYTKNGYLETGSAYFGEWNIRMVYYEKVID
jgi:ribosomal protein S18 acetylase RimI-like enzyme